VVFSSATPDICSVSGDVATFLAIGDCVINADQAADDTYAKATTATQHVTVVGAEQSLTFDTTPPAHAVVGGHYVVRAIGGESGNPVVFSSGSTRICSVSGATVTFTAVGTCVVVAQQAGDSMYAPAFATQRIPVGKRTEHPTLRLASPKRGVLKAKVTANPRLRGLLVRLYVHTHHHDKKIESAHTNRHGVAVLKHRETPGKVLHIRARLAASATTKSAQTAIKTVTIKT
jgi:hypothetical protein